MKKNFKFKAALLALFIAITGIFAFSPKQHMPEAKVSGLFWFVGSSFQDQNTLTDEITKLQPSHPGKTLNTTAGGTLLEDGYTNADETDYVESIYAH